MKFDATTGPEPLDYDFTGYGVDAKGRVPEPTQDALGTFLDFFDELNEASEKAQEAKAESEWQAKANELTRKAEAAQAPEKFTVIGDGPKPEPVAVEAEPEGDTRTWRQIILGEDDKSRDFINHVAALCQNQPTAEQIWALPPRIRGAFNDMAINLFVFGKDDQGKATAGTNS